MSISANKFLERGRTNSNIDYIQLVNNQLKINPNSVNVDSSLYNNALEQYNNEIKKGNITRLDVPKGFCGYIDPRSGEFRVRPDPDTGGMLPGQTVPNIAVNDTTAMPVSAEKYPIDQCLQQGLAGSPSYTQKPEIKDNDLGSYVEIVDVTCGDDIDPVVATNIDWNGLMSLPRESFPEFAEEAAAADESYTSNNNGKKKNKIIPIIAMAALLIFRPFNFGFGL